MEICNHCGSLMLELGFDLEMMAYEHCCFNCNHTIWTYPDDEEEDEE